MNNRTALVTGGSRGIGRAACIALAERGAAVAVHYRAQAAAADEVVSEIQQSGGKAFAVQADMADAGDIQRLIEQVNATLGPIDILVNNAGEMTDGAVIDMSDEMWEQTLSVNLTAVFRCSRACIAAMQERQWGRIINLTSQAAYTGSANHAHYSASKAGLMGLTYSLAKELGAASITVNLVAPGRITTDMLLERMEGRKDEWMKQTPLKRLGRPEEVAAAIVFLASEDASYITGSTLHVNGGLLMS
ncbi:MAG: 3-oxoacyl-ACP reductase FabG [Burkholderiales bacterium]|nr:3-oxoacyl-ACP reductase FabG [Anaerolineae bacterium]